MGTYDKLGQLDIVFDIKWLISKSSLQNNTEIIIFTVMMVNEENLPFLTYQNKLTKF